MDGFADAGKAPIISARTVSSVTALPMGCFVFSISLPASRVLLLGKLNMACGIWREGGQVEGQV